ncbi:MAG: CaiB/BaiF CoA transferase family protein [Acidimicrobiales bacterium]
MPGPLAGYRVIELAGLGPTPFGAMMLADMGADVVRVDRLDGAGPVAGAFGSAGRDPLSRGRRSIAVDLKHPDGVATVLALVAGADVLVEGFRPGVAERLGVGPEPCLARNPRLVYGRMTGWGQDGPLAEQPGHDINYLALSGTLSAIGRAGEPPVPPLNLVADFGGGGMLLAFGVVCALLEAKASGKGQVVDTAMVDGSALLATMIHGLRAAGWWGDQRGTNLLDTGAWFYEVYETADGGYLAVGALEPKFCGELVRLVGLADPPSQFDRARWPDAKQRLAAVFRTRTRDEWCALFDGSEACVTPVLGMEEAPAHPHNAHRGTFVERSGVVQPAPAPRFSRTPGGITGPPPEAAGQDTDQVLADCGFDHSEIDRLRTVGAVR